MLTFSFLGSALQGLGRGFKKLKGCHSRFYTGDSDFGLYSWVPRGRGLHSVFLSRCPGTSLSFSLTLSECPRHARGGGGFKWLVHKQETNKVALTYHPPCFLGAGLGPSKTFHSNNGPLATPRRALGDLGNLNFESKTKGPVKPFGKTPKLHSATPLNQRSLLSQQVDSKKRKSITSTRKNHKKVNFLKDATISKEKVGPQFPEKEMMFPFIEKSMFPLIRVYIKPLVIHM